MYADMSIGEGMDISIEGEAQDHGLGGGMGGNGMRTNSDLSGDSGKMHSFNFFITNEHLMSVIYPVLSIF